MARRLRINTIGNLDPRSVRAAGLLKRIAGLAATLLLFCLLTAKPAAAQSMDYSDLYSGAAIDSYGYILGWGVTDVQYADSYHTAMVDTTLRSPNGRTSHMYAEDSNSARADVWLTYDPNDLGIYFTNSDHDADCTFSECIVCDEYTEATATQATATMSSAKTITDGLTATFSVTPHGATPTSIAWSFTYPQGAGNNPNVTFNPSNSQSTTTNGHWFAYPDTTCASGGLGFTSVYTIKSTVTFPGTTKIPSTTLTVSLLQIAGDTVRPTVVGDPAIFNQSQDVWVVNGAGSLTRTVPAVIIYFPTSSQFYNKTLAHENKHVQQWTSGMVADLYLVSNLMTQLYPLTDSTESGLRAQISTAKNNWLAGQDGIWQTRSPAMEAEAYAAADPIAPQYAYQSSCQ